MYVSTNSHFSIYDTEFSYNKANLTSTIEVLGSSTTNNNTITGSTFNYNSAIKNTLSLMYSLNIISQSTFSYN